MTSKSKLGSDTGGIAEQSESPEQVTRLPDDSEPSLRTLAMPADANANGDIFGGWLMSQMDLAGGIHAQYIARGRVATVAVDAMHFEQPVKVGDTLSIYCKVERVGRTSLAIRIRAFASRLSNGEVVKVTEGLFTFVAIDDAGKPRSLPVRSASD